MNGNKFWLLSAGKDGELWPTFWIEKKIAIGWSALGDLRLIHSKDSLWKEMEKNWPYEKPKARSNSVTQVWRFYKEISKGDVVFVRAYGALIGIALVEGEYDFLRDSDPLREKFYSPYFKDYFPNVRNVRWVSLWGGMKQPLTLTKLTVL